MRFLIFAACMVLVAGAANAGDPGPEDAPAAPEIVSVEPAATWISPIVNGPKPAPEPSPWHVGLSGGQGEIVALAAGYTLSNIRFELEGGYNVTQTHDTKRPPCKRRHHSRGTRKCETQRSFRMGDLTLGVYPTLELAEKLFVYAGGGIGLLFVDDQSQVDVEGVAKVAGGLEVEVFDRVTFGVGYKAVFGFQGYDRHGVNAGIRYSF